MTTSKKKNIRWKALSVPLIVGAVGVWTFLGMNWLWDLSSANSSSISESNRVSVEGVENSAQYLTSMVLHMGDEWPNDTKVVTLYYDTGAKALHISGNVNANALIIGNKNEALSGTTAIGGEGNKILDGSENALIMGGKDNSLTSATNSIVLGGRGTTAASANNLAIIGASETRVPIEGAGAPKENILVAGGHGNVVKWSNVVILWEGNNEAGSDSVLIGKNIKAKNVQKVFVWSDNGTFSPKKSGAFYVNTKNGIWFNTNDPKVKFDIGGLGGKWAIKIAAKWGFVSESGKCNEQYAGLMAYVKVWGKSGLCGCNGAERVPLSSDPSTHGVCVNMNQRQCAGWDQHTIKTTPSQALPKWNPELNAGDGGWEDVKWVYGGIQYPGSTGKECGYTCQTGYHAGVDFPDGWQMWGCLPSTEIPNRYTGEKPDGSTFNGWWTPGTGNDNCHFGCKAGYKHKDQPGVERSCSGCNIGTYTPENNQRAECKDCVKPLILNGDNRFDVKYFVKYARDRNLLGLTNTREGSGFKGWTTTGYSEYSCNFHCDERFAYKHDTNTTGSCTFCQPGSYSSGDSFGECRSCSAVTGALEFVTNGSKDWTHAGATRLDCDFNCKWGYAYKNNGGTDRSCTDCGKGYYTTSGQDTTCKQCTNKPSDPKAHYKDWGNASSNCEWYCEAGYTKIDTAGYKGCVRGSKPWFSTCTPACGSSCTVTRTVTCYNGSGQNVALGYCRGSDTAGSKTYYGDPCPPPPPPTPPTPPTPPLPPSGWSCSWEGGPCGKFVGSTWAYCCGSELICKSQVCVKPGSSSGGPSTPQCTHKGQLCGGHAYPCCAGLTCKGGTPDQTIPYHCEWSYWRTKTWNCHKLEHNLKTWTTKQRWTMHKCSVDADCSWMNGGQQGDYYIGYACVGANDGRANCNGLINWGGTEATFQARCQEHYGCKWFGSVWKPWSANTCQP